MMKIESVGLVKVLANKKVINEVNLKVEEGEIVGLLGKNGAGKTVLMNILTGLLLPTKGKVKYNGKDIEYNIKNYWERINWASAYQSLQLQATTKENLETFAGIYGVEKSRIDEVLDLVGMNEHKIKNKKLFLLSSGEIGRVNLAKALLNRPEILFLDEPTAFLDPVFKIRLIEILEKINREWETTIIFSSHQLDEVVELCQRVVVLKEGNISYIGKPVKVSKLIEYY